MSEPARPMGRRRVGVLLVNLGSPAEPRTGPVRRYLREFLSDPRVIDINPIGRALLLELIVLPFRSSASAHAYRKIWRPDGSPLIVFGGQLRDAVAARLSEHEIALAMRYGEPSIAGGLGRLRAAGCDHLVVLPLYPQYASSSTGSTLEKLYGEAARLWNTPFVSVVPPFYDEPGFLDAFAEVGRPVLGELDPDHVLFSFHGLPERHVRKSDETGRYCLSGSGCCERIVDANRNCYRAQCFATARGLAARLSLSAERYTVCFQSRFGRTKWIEPYTDVLLEQLPARGIKRVAVFCPAFVADCLETLEEIGMRGDEAFRAAGGEELRLVPSLNAHPAWVETVVGLIERAAGRLPV